MKKLLLSIGFLLGSTLAYAANPPPEKHHPIFNYHTGGPDFVTTISTNTGIGVSSITFPDGTQQNTAGGSPVLTSSGVAFGSASNTVTQDTATFRWDDTNGQMYILGKGSTGTIVRDFNVAGPFDYLIDDFRQNNSSVFQLKSANGANGGWYFYDPIGLKRFLTFNTGIISTITVHVPIGFRGTVDISTGVTLNGSSGNLGDVWTSGGAGTVPSYQPPAAGGSGKTMVQMSTATDATRTTTTGTTFTNTTLTVTVIPTNAVSTITIDATGYLELTSASENVYATIARDGNILSTFFGLCTMIGGASAGATVTTLPCHMTMDVIANSTASTTFTVQIRSQNGGTVAWSDSAGREGYMRVAEWK